MISKIVWSAVIILIIIFVGSYELHDTRTGTTNDEIRRDFAKLRMGQKEAEVTTILGKRQIRVNHKDSRTYLSIDGPFGMSERPEIIFDSTGSLVFASCGDFHMGERTWIFQVKDSIHSKK